MKLIRTAALLGAGYVLGARAGRERYEQIVTIANKIWTASPIRHTFEKAAATATSEFEQATAAPGNTVKNAAQALKNRVATMRNDLDDDVIVVEPVN